MRLLYRVDVQLNDGDTMTYMCKFPPSQEFTFIKLELVDKMIYLHKESITRMDVYHTTR